MPYHPEKFLFQEFDFLDLCSAYKGFGLTGPWAKKIFFREEKLYLQFEQLRTRDHHIQQLYYNLHNYVEFQYMILQNQEGNRIHDHHQKILLCKIY